MTKDEILDKHLNDNHGAGQTYRDIQKAMDEYAKEVAIGFAEYMARYSLYYYSKKPYKYIVRQQPSLSGKWKPETFTATQLFDNYILEHTKAKQP